MAVSLVVVDYVDVVVDYADVVVDYVDVDVDVDYVDVDDVGVVRESPAAAAAAAVHLPVWWSAMATDLEVLQYSFSASTDCLVS